MYFQTKFIDLIEFSLKTESNFFNSFIKNHNIPPDRFTKTLKQHGHLARFEALKKSFSAFFTADTDHQELTEFCRYLAQTNLYFFTSETSQDPETGLISRKYSFEIDNRKYRLAIYQDVNNRIKVAFQKETLNKGKVNKIFSKTIVFQEQLINVIINEINSRHSYNKFLAGKQEHSDLDFFADYSYRNNGQLKELLLITRDINKLLFFKDISTVTELVLIDPPSLFFPTSVLPRLKTLKIIAHRHSGPQHLVLGTEHLENNFFILENNNLTNVVGGITLPIEKVNTATARFDINILLGQVLLSDAAKIKMLIDKVISSLVYNTIEITDHFASDSDGELLKKILNYLYQKVEHEQEYLHPFPPFSNNRLKN